MRARLLSVVVCTHNRALDVLECLNALHPQVDPASTELLIVDSASSVAERAALEAGLKAYPKVRHIRLDQPGLSIARNAAIEASTGEWVAFVDDDAVPHPDWHARLLAVLDRMPDDCGAVGGRILPIYPNGERPALGPRWKMYVSINDNLGERDCTEKFGLIAANCCFRRTALVAAGGFPLDLGRVAGSLLSGEDVMLMRRLRDRGWRIRYQSEFCVGHKVSQERLTRRWVRTRAYWEGITTIRMARLLDEPRPYRLPLKAVLAAPVAGAMALLGRPADEWDLRFWFDCGLLAETLGLAPASGARKPE